MNTTSIFGLSALVLALAIPAAQAEAQAKPEAARLGEHPAVIVARKGVQVDPASKFYLHPARLSWTLQRPAAEDERREVVVAAGAQNATIHP